MKAYSIDLRGRVLADCDSGLTTKVVAQKYRVSAAIVRRWKQRRRETGEVGPRPRRAGRKRRVDRDAVAAAVREKPDATLRELRDQLGLSCTLMTLWRVLRELGLSFKKKYCTPPSRTARMSPRVARNGRRGKSGSTRGA